MSRTSAPPVLLAALLAAGCAGSLGESGYYGSLRGGAWSPAGDGKTGQLRAGAELAIGRRWSPWLRTELGMGFAPSQGTFLMGADSQGSPPLTATRLDADVVTITGSARVSQVVGPLEGWLLAGAGGFRVEPSTASDAMPPTERRPRTQLGGQVGAGVLLPLGAGFEASLEARAYRTIPSWTGAEGKVQGVGILAGVGFLF